MREEDSFDCDMDDSNNFGTTREDLVDNYHSNNNNNNNSRRSYNNNSSGNNDDNDSFSSSKSEVVPDLVDLTEQQAILDATEDNLFAQLEQSIMNAEEAEVMDQLDQSITEAEEKDLLGSISIQIDESSQSLVQYLQHATDHNVHAGLDECWENLKRTPISRLLEYYKPQQQNGNPTRSLLVECLEEYPINQSIKKLPKRLNRTDEYPLFTIKEFQDGCISTIQDSIRKAWPQCYFQISIEDYDHDSYLLHVESNCSPQDEARLVQVPVEDWMSKYIKRYNMYRVLTDKESSKVTLMVEAKNIGADLIALTYNSQPDKPITGVLIDSCREGGEIITLFGYDIAKYGVVIINANNIPIDGNLKKLVDIVVSVKSIVATPPPKMLLTLCISKYADLSRLDGKILAEAITRMDGTPYQKPSPAEAAINIQAMNNYHLQRSNDVSIDPLTIDRIFRNDKKKDVAADKIDKEEDDDDDDCATLDFSTPFETNKKRLKAFQYLVSDGQSILMDIQVPTKRPLGVIALGSRKSSVKGLWVDRFKPNSLLLEILGPAACVSGVAIVKVSNKTCSTPKTFKKLRDEARSSKKLLNMTLCFSRTADLSGFVRRFLGSSRKNPRLVNGKLYTIRKSTVAKSKAKQFNAKQQENKGKQESKSNETANATKKDASTEQTKQSNPFADASASTAIKINSHKLFTEKYKVAVEIEYKRSGIKLQKVLSSMWKCHKKLFGDLQTCDDNCPCINNVAAMAENVVTDYLSKSKDEVAKGLVPGKRFVGFIDFFIPKFLPRINELYPNDKPSEKLDRLASMWKLHLGQPRFGMTCFEHCECDEAWDLIFAQGDTTKMNKKRRRIEDGKEIAKNSNISKKRLSATDMENLHIKKKPKKQNTAPLITPRKEANKSRLGKGFSLKNLAPISSSKEKAASATTTTTASTMKSYDVVFDPNQPLGAYFVNESKFGQEPICKVFSLYPYGQAKKDQRIYPGSVVVSATISDEQVKVKNSSDLQRCYEKAQHAKTNLTLAFVNSAVLRNANQGDPHQYWNQGGNWQGPNKNGWPGGAASFRKNSVPSATTTPTATTKTTTNIAQTNSSNNNNSNNNNYINNHKEGQQPNQQIQAAAVPGHHEAKPWKNVPTATTRPNHRTKEPEKSLLKKPSTGVKVARGKQVKFKSQFEFTYYTKDATPLESLDREHQETVEPPAANEETAMAVDEYSTVSAEDQFCDAVRHKTMLEVSQMLNNGITGHMADAKACLQGEYGYLKETLAKIRLERVRYSLGSNLAERERDSNEKFNAIKIYLNSMFVIEKAVSLKSWVNIEFRPARIYIPTAFGLDNTVYGCSKFYTGRVQCEVEGKYEALGHLPMLPKSETAEYSKDTPILSIKNNKQFVWEQRYLLIVVEEFVQMPKMTTTTSKLGHCKVALSHVQSEIAANGFVTLQLHLQRQSAVAGNVATITLEGSVGSVEIDYINKKQNECIDLLRQQVKSIKNLNVELQSRPYKFKAHIMASNKVSLLHAAIHMVLPEEVQDLVSLGADPHKKSGLGSCIVMAQRLLDRVREKEEAEINRLRPQHDDDPEGLFTNEDEQYKDNGKLLSLSLKVETFSNIIRCLKGYSVDEHVDGINNIDNQYSNNITNINNSSSSIERNNADSVNIKSIDNDDSNNGNSNVIENEDSGDVNSGAEHHDPLYDMEELNIHKKVYAPAAAARNNDASAISSFNPAFNSNIPLAQPTPIPSPAPLLTASMDPPANNTDQRIGTSNSLKPLPSLQSDWFVPARARCHRFNTPQNCKFGASCHFKHVQGPLGEIIDDDQLFANYSFVLNNENITVRHLKGWYTAAYRDRTPNMSDVYFYAERGPNAHRSDAGVYWYATAADAVTALNRVVIVAKHGLRNIWRGAAIKNNNSNNFSL